MKIRNKLTYKFALLVASILMIFSLAVYFFSASYRAEEFDKRLIDKGLTTARLLVAVDEVDEKLLRIIDKNNLSALQKEQITIYDSLYTKIYSSDDDPEVPVTMDLFREIKENKQVFFNHDESEAVGILYYVPQNKKSFFVIVSAYDKFGINKLRFLRLILVVGFIFSIGGVFIAGWIFAGQAIKPVSQIIHQVKKISVKNMDLRVNEGNGQDELAQLAIQFNQMLERLGQAFEAQRSFVSNASHELRTPLSVIRAQLEVSLSDERQEVEYKNILESVLQDINDLISLSNGLLDLAQVGTDLSSSSFKKVRLDELLYQSVADVSKKYPQQSISFKIEEEMEDEKMFIVLANENLLKTAFINLLDNACKFSNGEKVMINIGFLAKDIMISIVDLGLGIKPAETPHIFDPFYRGSNARSITGHGIGLPLAKKIISLHKGNMDISSKLNEGTNVIVYLPLAD